MGKIILIALGAITIANASHPTTEGLFRNGNNPEVTTNLIVVKAMVTTKASEELLEKEASEVVESEERKIERAEDKKPFFVKYLLSFEPEKPLQMIQVLYSDGKMSDESIIDVSFLSNVKNKVTKTSRKKGLFYSLLSTLALNRSTEMNKFLKENSQDYMSNKQLVNKERESLYNKYKNYLNLVKSDDSLKESMENPVKPNDPDVAKTVRKILKKPFFTKDKSLSLIKAQQGYQWKLKNDVLLGFFDSDTLRIETLEFENIDTKIKFNFDDYLLFNGTHELPKNITIKDKNDDIKIRIVGLTHLLLRDKSMAKRYGEYREKFSKLTLSPEGRVQSFLLD